MKACLEIFGSLPLPCQTGVSGDTATWLGSWATTLSALISIVALVGIGLTVNYTKKQLRLSLRPHLKALQFVFELKEGNQNGHFHLINEGGEDATFMQSRHTLFLTDKPLPQMHPTSDLKVIGGGLVIGPGQAKKEIIHFEPPLDIDTIRKIESGRLEMYIVGWIAYKGSLPTHYWTQFFRKYNSRENRFEVVDYSEWEYRS